jgi:hypothetical protein
MTPLKRSVFNIAFTAVLCRCSEFQYVIQFAKHFFCCIFLPLPCGIENPSRIDNLGCLLCVYSVVFKLGKEKWSCHSVSKLGIDGSGGVVTLVSTSAIDGDGLSTSRHDRFTPRQELQLTVE